MAQPAVLGVLFNEFPPLVTPLKSKFVYYPFSEVQEKAVFLAEKGESIRGLVVDVACKVSEDLLSKLPNLEIVSAFSVGTDNVDLQLCKQRSVVVTNTPDVLSDDVADLALALTLTTMRQIAAADRYIRDGKWLDRPYPLTTQVSGKRVGIAGLGRIGVAIAKRFEGFGCSIRYWSRSEKKEFPYKYSPTITDLAKESDILMVVCALTPETTGVVNREVLDALGPKGYVINVARGPVINEAELVKALVEGRIAGAGLDVFEKEPYVPEELLKMDNVVVQPHVGSGTVETRKAMADLVVANLEAHFSGKPVLTRVV
ncbi:unnamed protein product [Calypogeia fissa]